MEKLKQQKFKGLAAAAKIGALMVLLFGVLLYEPCLRAKLTYAITFFDNPKISQAPEKIVSDIDNELSGVKTSTEQQKSRAPEPATLIMFLGGLGGMVVRFARKSFDRFKRFTDVVLALAGLTMLMPLLAFAALLIKLDSRGPIIYRQNRVGKNGRIFRIFKLRSMRADAEKGTGAVWAKKNDPRITPVGRFLRKSHIDEIPQLFNVLKGEMSIVGPRPERPEIVRDLRNIIVDYEKRLLVKPGITGLAQVWHKYDESIEDVKKKIKYDLLYIHKMCLWVDLRIIGKTFVSVVTGRGAN